MLTHLQLGVISHAHACWVAFSVVTFDSTIDGNCATTRNKKHDDILSHQRVAPNLCICYCVPGRPCTAPVVASDRIFLGTWNNACCLLCTPHSKLGFCLRMSVIARFWYVFYTCVCLRVARSNWLCWGNARWRTVRNDPQKSVIKWVMILSDDQVESVIRVLSGDMRWWVRESFVR